MINPFHAWHGCSGGIDLNSREKYVASALIGYLAGSVNTGVLASKYLYQDDVRDHGSGNAGATNMARTFGLSAGAVTLIGDMTKTVFSMSAGWVLERGWGMAIAGASCLVGHCYPIFFKFKGGKGVAVGAALSLMIDPRVFLSGCAAFAVGFGTTRRVSAGSIVSAIAVPVAGMTLPLSTPRKLLSLFAGSVILFEHRPNIDRIFSGNEPEFTLPNKEKSGN